MTTHADPAYAVTSRASIPSLDINDLKRFSAAARVNMPLIASKDFVTRMNCYEPGQVTPFHMHPNDDEIIFCVEGRGAITFADRPDVPLGAGTLITLPAGLPHGIAAAPDSRMVVIYAINAKYTSERAEGGPGDAAVALNGERK